MSKGVGASFPSNVVELKEVGRNYTSEHIFCSHCGKEITKMDFKKGRLRHPTYYIGWLADGRYYHYCWNRFYCVKERELKHES